MVVAEQKPARAFQCTYETTGKRVIPDENELFHVLRQFILMTAYLFVNFYAYFASCYKSTILTIMYNL